MDYVIRSGVAVLLVGTGLLAPAAAPPPSQAHDVQLTAASDILEKLAAANADLISRFDARIDQMLSDNAELVASGKGDAMTTGALQAAVFGLLGVRTYDPLAWNASLLSDPDSAYAEFGGFEGYLLQHGTPDAVLLDDLRAFNTELITAQYGFNTALVEHEAALAQAIFGTDNPLEDVVNRSFNAFNMVFDAQQQGLNGLLGLTDYDPQDLTASLLHGSGPFNDGDVGGITGGVFQGLAALLVADLQSSDLSGLLDNFDGAAFTDALHGLFGTLADGPFGDVLAGLPDLLLSLL